MVWKVAHLLMNRLNQTESAIFTTSFGNYAFEGSPFFQILFKAAEMEACVLLKSMLDGVSSFAYCISADFTDSIKPIY